MSFLFGKKKGNREPQQPPNAGPQMGAVREKDKFGPNAMPPNATPGSSVNNSLNSLGGGGPNDPNRSRIDQESPVSLPSLLFSSDLTWLGSMEIVQEDLLHPTECPIQTYTHGRNDK